MFIVKSALGLVFNVAVFGILLSGPAGTLRWWRAWAFLGVVAGATTASTIVW